MRSIPRLACLAATSLALTACQGEQKTAQQGTAEGEILPGSASDAMLPYDTVRSQPPLAPMPTDSPKSGAKQDGDEEADATASDAATGEGPGEPSAEGAAEPKAAP